MAKGDNHSLMGPNFELGKIVKSTAMIPGAPGGMGGDSNNPYPVQQATSTPVNPTSLYGDLSLNNLTQVGTGILDPGKIERSPLYQHQPPGIVNNAGAQYGLQPQNISETGELKITSNFDSLLTKKGAKHVYTQVPV